MYAPQAVAKTMLELGHAQGITLTNLTLQKLIYLAHGLSLAKRGKALVDENFQAWKYGPVVESLYHDLKVFGPSPVSKDSWYVKSWAGLPPEDKEAYEAIAGVLQQCGRMTGGKLIEFTHDQRGPWHAVYEADNKGIEIPNEDIESYFKTIVKK